MRRAYTLMKDRQWLFFAIGVFVPTSVSEAVYFVWTNGAEGWKPLVAAIIGAATAIVMGAIVTLWLRSARKAYPSEPIASNLSEEVGSNSAPDRIFCPRSPRELLHEVAGLTEIQREVVAQRYIGTWLSVEGSIMDIGRALIGDEYVVYLRADGMTRSMTLEFDAQRWGTTISLCNKADRVKINGQIAAIGGLFGTYIHLANCELLSH